MSSNSPSVAPPGRSVASLASGASFLRLKIRGRLIAGFTAICLVLAAAVGYTVYMVGGIAVTVDRMVSLRTPVALESTELVGNLYSTLATLRGYLLTGNPQGKADRAAMWKELDHNRADFDKMASRFTNPENIRKWNETKTLLDEFRAAQDKAEAVAFTPDALPATKLLVSEAAPRAEIIARELTRMIDEEATLEATAERKLLLKTMADVRGNFGLAIAYLRAYLLNGDAAFKESFAGRWANVQKAMAVLEEKSRILSATQRTAYQAMLAAYGEFAPLPEKMFALRQSPQWNMPVHILVTEAAPRALKILDLLDGPKQADGTRKGGIKTNQKQMLAEESADVSGGISFLQTVQWVLLAIGLAAGAVITFFTARAIVTPIRAMTDAMKRLAGGDTGVAIPAVGRSDEVGEMAGAVQVFKDNMIETERMRAEQAESEKRAEAEKKAAMNALADNFEASVRGVVNTVSSAATEMQSSAQSMTATAEETSRQSTAVAAASEEASTNVQTVASAAEELSSSVSEISRQVAQSTKITTKAVDEAARTNASVQGLADAAQKIGDVVQLINDIAAQTNLLALNATIEAARAGEAGKGFAVVASEVKSLANQTAKATEEIGAQISAIQGATNEAVEAIKGIGATIAEVNQIATSIASAVEEQGAATQEIARNVQQAAAGTTEVSTNITGVTQAASETGSAATQLLSAAGELSKQSETLRTEVDRFLAKVRAA